MSDLRALTVWQPWASFIIVLAKPYEFRGWKAFKGMIGQRIVIHAAQRPIHVEEIDDIEYKLAQGGHLAAQTCLYPHLAAPVLKLARENALPLGAGIGTAVLGEPRSGNSIARDFGLPHVNDSDRDDHSNWGWPMLEVERWADPVLMRGAQGFWRWPDPQDFGL